MTRTVTALYETQAQAEEARASLEAANLGQHVDITDKSGDGKGHHGGLLGWLGDLFGGHHDQHLYDEGLRRGHVLLTARVDDFSETRAAEILDAAAPVDLAGAAQTWRGEGWTAPTPGPASPVPAPPGPAPPGLAPPGAAPPAAVVVEPDVEDGIAQGLDDVSSPTTSPPPGGLEPQSLGAGVRVYSPTGLG